MKILTTARNLARLGLGLLASASVAVSAQTTSCKPVTCSAAQATSCKPVECSSGYDVFLLIGQSNMAGRGVLPTPIDEDGKPNPAIKMWDGTKYVLPEKEAEWADASTKRIIEAKDPIIHTQHHETDVVESGLGMTFAKAYLNFIRESHPNRKVLLVGAAWGGTGFAKNKFKTETLTRRWLKVDSKDSLEGDLYREAISRANNAIAAGLASDGDKTTVFKGILWHQGEHDILNNGGENYEKNHMDLMTALRTKIVGANSAPIVVGEMAPCFLARCKAKWMSGDQAVTTADRDKVLTYLRDIQTKLPMSAWVSSAGLKWNDDRIHFDNASLRELGRRYFSKYWEATQNLPMPIVDLKVYDDTIFNVGRSIDVDSGRYSNYAVTPSVIVSPRTTGNLSKNGGANSIYVIADRQFGNVVKVTADAISLSTLVGGELFNGSYTKMGWVNLASYVGRNNIISANNPAQAHYFYTPSQDGVFAAGHSSLEKRIKSDVKAHSAINIGTWTHVAVTYDASSKTITLYINGSPVDTSTNIAPATQASGLVTLNVPGWMDTNNYVLNGSMISAKVYDSALSGSQIKQVYDFELDWQKGYGRR